MNLARASRQLPLLDVPPRYRLNSNATVRNAYGCAVQEIVCSALEIDGIPINGKCEVCFDAEDDEGGFYEIKSVHRSGKVVVYDWRMKKEESAGVPLTYAILVHRVRGERDGARVFASMAESKPEILLLTAKTVHEVARREPLRQLLKANPDPRFGYSRKGYRDGYRNISVRALQSLCELWKRRAFTLHGCEFQIPIFAE